jgi:uncharacterized protein
LGIESRLNREKRRWPKSGLPEVIPLTPQEEQLLNALVERVNQTQLQEKDPDAEALLKRSLGPNPDALYILAQTVLVQNIALDQARAQVTQLQQQVEQAQQMRQPAHATSFLGSLLGRREAESAPAQPQAPASRGPRDPASGSWPGQYQPVQQYAQGAPPPQQYAQTQVPQPQYVPVPAEQPSFLRGAMQTAAGVAAGALAFEGVESILHGFGHPAYGWDSPGLMGGGFDRPVEETVINNYYDDPNAQGGPEHHGMESGGEQHFRDSGDQSGAQFSDASYDTSGDGNERDSSDRDDSSNDDSSDFDNSGNDDTSGFDDSSSFDDGGGFDSGGDNVV